MPIGPVIQALPKPAPEPVFPQPPMQRVHRRTSPLSVSELADARAQEALRLQWDTFYITAADARKIPQALYTPEMIQRIKYSQRDWPENRMSLTHAIGPVEPGEGEQYLGDRAMDVNDVFWSPEPGATSPEHQLPGRRMERPERPYR